jgi:hypothetical protein
MLAARAPQLIKRCTDDHLDSRDGSGALSRLQPSAALSDANGEGAQPQGAALGIDLFNLDERAAPLRGCLITHVMPGYRALKSARGEE